MARATNDPFNLSLGAAADPRRSARRRPHPTLPPLPPPSIHTPEPDAPTEERHETIQPSPFAVTSTGFGTEAQPTRRRGSRGGRRHKKAVTATAEPPKEASAVTEPEPQAKPKRRRGSRGGRRRKKAVAVVSEPRAEVATSSEPAQEPPAAREEAEPETKPKRRRGSRGGRRHKKAAATVVEPKAEAPAAEGEAKRRTPSKQATADAVPSTVAAKPPLSRRARIPVTGAPTDAVPKPFAHPAEYEFARILDFYGIEWQYEPRSFPLRRANGHV
ncbi:MAG: hypothetical protein IH864_05805, partial [Chloroflexi bacterium]|nr:hypothetical protein [Chloroflexota bacterium]